MPDVNDPTGVGPLYPSKPARKPESRQRPLPPQPRPERRRRREEDPEPDDPGQRPPRVDDYA